MGPFPHRTTTGSDLSLRLGYISPPNHSPLQRPQEGPQYGDWVPMQVQILARPVDDEFVPKRRERIEQGEIDGSSLMSSMCMRLTHAGAELPSS